MRSPAVYVSVRFAGSASPFRRAAAVLALLLIALASFPAAAETAATEKPAEKPPLAGALTAPVVSPPASSAPPAVGAIDTSAEVRGLQILAIRSDDAFEQADALTAALKRAVQRAPAWQLPPGDFSLEVLVAALDCSDPPNAACLAEIANRTKSSHFLYGSLYRIGKGVRADLHVWQAGEQTSLQFDYSDNLVEPADDALINISRLALANLVGLDAGKVEVEVDLDPTTLRWNGREIAVATGGKASLVLPAGDHTLVAQSLGHRDENAFFRRV